MTNFVTVQGQFTDGTNPGEGNFMITASGGLNNSTGVAIVTPVVHNVLDSTGALWNGTTVGSGVQLLASDNFGAGELTWDFHLRVRGLPEIDVYDAVVNFSNGATQQLFAILTAAGWTPLVI